MVVLIDFDMLLKGESAISRNYRSKLSGRDLRASSIGWEIALPIVAGPVIGYFIDRHFQTEATFTLIFLGIGLATGIGNLIRFIVYEFAMMRSAEEEKKKDGNHD